MISTTTSSRRVWLILLIIGLGVAPIIGCGSADAPLDAEQLASDTPTATTEIIRGTVTPAVPTTPEPTEPPVYHTPDPSEPFNYGQHVTMSNIFDPGSTVEWDQLIVTGSVAAILPARWTTPDGKRPDNPWEVVPEKVTIVTPIVIKLDAPPIQNRTSESLESGRVVALINGGTVGQDSMTVHMPDASYTVGERILLTLSTRANSYGICPAGPIMVNGDPGWWIGQKWTISDDGQATSYFGSGPLTEIEARFREAIDWFESNGWPSTPTR